MRLIRIQPTRLLPLAALLAALLGGTLAAAPAPCACHAAPEPPEVPAMDRARCPRCDQPTRPGGH